MNTLPKLNDKDIRTPFFICTKKNLGLAWFIASAVLQYFCFVKTRISSLPLVSGFWEVSFWINALMVSGIQFLNIWQTLKMFMACLLLLLFFFIFFWPSNRKKARFLIFIGQKMGFFFLLLTDVMHQNNVWNIKGRIAKGEECLCKMCYFSKNVWYLIQGLAFNDKVVALWFPVSVMMIS